MSCEYIFDLATGLYDQMTPVGSVSTSSISGKLVSSGMLGKLNIDINGCYTLESGCIVPPLGSEEQSLYTTLYLIGYYQTQAAQAVGNPLLLYTRLAEGDTTISRDSPIALAKFYTALQKQAFDQYRILLQNYKGNASVVRSVDYLNPPRHPNNGFGGGCGNNWRC